MSKHTPGEWKITKSSMKFMHADVTAPGDHPDQLLLIATIHSVDGFKGNSDANARLIAAAPDLLEAAKELLEHHMGEFTPHLSNLRRAIKKAEGNNES